VRQLNQTTCLGKQVIVFLPQVSATLKAY